MDTDTIAAIATPPGEGGIGIIRISGSNSKKIANKLFKDKKDDSLIDLEERKLHYGHIVDPTTGRIIDEVMAVYMNSPKTYTAEDIVEVHCHGGIISVKRILDLILNNGAKLAERGEFTKRAFLNGRIDLSQAEAVIDLIKSKTESNFDMSLNQLSGSVSKEVSILRDMLIEMLAHIEASIDFSEHDIEESDTRDFLESAKLILENIDRLLNTAETGRIIKDGIKTVILGKPNVGKSSLMNKLLGEDRAIVTDIPGTTRDIIEEYISLNGIPLRVVDTAGIRDTSDIVEKIGIDRAKEELNTSDLVIIIFDASSKLDEEDLKIIKLIEYKNTIALLNKTDLEPKLSKEDIKSVLPNHPIIETSLINNYGLEEIEYFIKKMFFNNDIRIEDDTIITNARQKNLLLKARENILDAIDAINMNIPIDCLEVDIKSCWQNIGEITGDTSGEEVLDKIFSDFCIGK
ncbi:MAG: tRNA uridine-5-carboxymethylaminomethyl(34) synthesis GTPase MnmE [Andreesenia angusta]|nr:tRNA uridine-5-carboxymethylaminomethyl(34) synthesis GTPase MnmE [Andreesenia angusta]